MFDPGGKYAVQGRCSEALLERWLQHPLLLRRTGRPHALEAVRADRRLAQAVGAGEPAAPGAAPPGGTVGVMEAGGGFDSQ